MQDAALPHLPIHQDALAAVLSHTTIPQLILASKVSLEWHTAVYSAVLPSLHVLDLRAHAVALTDERLLPVLKSCPQLTEVRIRISPSCCRFKKMLPPCDVTHSLSLQPATAQPVWLPSPDKRFCRSALGTVPTCNGAQRRLHSTAYG